MKLYSDIELAEILNQEVFHLISDAADALHLECYVVGGYVRDIFLERPSNDIDVVVVGSGIALAQEVKKRLGRRAHLSVFKNFGTAQVKVNGHSSLELEFVGARKESYSHDSRKPVVENGTLEDDQNRRDFTINAMAICLNKERFGQLIDPFDGLYDLEDRIIATPLDPDITFSDDPLRMLRCVRFATQLNFDIEPETFEALGRNADRLKIISWERIADEMNKIMLSKHPSIGFDYLYRSGLLQIILPELVELDHVEVRNGRAHKNNYLHTLEVLENVAKAPSNLPPEGEVISPSSSSSHEAISPSESSVSGPSVQTDDVVRKYQTADPLTYDLLKAFSRENRNVLTEAEAVLWMMLRGKQLGVKFRRQHIVGDFIVDFICLDHRLVIEVDGKYHLNEEQVKADAYRTKILNELGYTEIRFTNDEILQVPDKVKAQIQSVLKTSISVGSKTSGSEDKASPSGGRLEGASLWLRWAALLHDIGKPKSKRWDNLLGWTFHNHNYIGAKMVPAIFRRLKLPLGAEMKYVQKLVDLHMRPIAIADDEVTDSAVRRLLNDAGDDIDDLMTLCEADITSKNEVRKARFRENFRLVREKLADLQVRDYKRLLQPVIDGNEIMELFGLKPSREVGALKQCLKDAVLDNKVPNEREPLMQLLMEKARKMGLSSRKDC